MQFQAQYRAGRVIEANEQFILARGLSDVATVGDLVEIIVEAGVRVGGEITAVETETIRVMVDGSAGGIALDKLVLLRRPFRVWPSERWLGNVIDPFCCRADGSIMFPGLKPFAIDQPPPPASLRKHLGPRLETGLRAFNTLLPLVRGQRLGLFAGSGVGKSSLLADLARGVDADVVVVAQVGERGRELRHFVEEVLGPEGMARTVVVAATSDQSPLTRRRCARTAMTVAEYFRDEGKHVLLLFDSMTRFAEAHREIALANGESADLGGYPPSLAREMMHLCERAGTGEEGKGDITAIFSVLVPGSDMENPVADILRGVLDGHIVMDREIAERGRFPAIDLVRSVSRSLPAAATEEENQLIAQAREMLAVYDRSELMVQSGLYTSGGNPQLDRAVSLWPKLDGFLAEKEPGTTEDSFNRLRELLNPS